MIKQDTTLFSNNCGKLYRNKVVFASQSECVDTKDIKSISLRKSISKGSLFFIFLPGLFFAVPFFVNDYFEKILFTAFGVGFTTLALFMAKRNTNIYVAVKNGRNLNLKIWHGYTREAQRFVDETRKLVARKSQLEEVDSELESANLLLHNQEVRAAK